MEDDELVNLGSGMVSNGKKSDDQKWEGRSDMDGFNYCQKITIRIGSPDDNNLNSYETNLDIYSTYELRMLPQAISDRNGYGFNYPTLTRTGQKKHWNSLNRTVLSIQLMRSRLKGEPLVLSISKSLTTYFGWNNRRVPTPRNFKMRFVFPDLNGTFIFLERKHPYYYLMNNRLRKKDTMVAISRAIYRSCFEEDGQLLLNYVFKMIVLPENVSYVLENRTPYWWIDTEDRVPRVECRLNTKMISDNECAIEISNNIWAPISIDDLNVFVNYYHHHHTRTAQWKFLSPKKLWTKLMGKEPTSSQLKLMIEFLSQNRTQDLIENRAEELMHGLTIKYPERIKIFDYKNESGKVSTIMIVRGQLCDWIIIDAEWKSKVQKVKTYVYISDDVSVDKHQVQYARHRRQTQEFFDGRLKGPICIDNIHNNSSVGDQYAARALALLNDKATVELVNTIRRYIPTDILDGFAESRLPFDEINAENANWEDISQ